MLSTHGVHYHGSLGRGRGRSPREREGRGGREGARAHESGSERREGRRREGKEEKRRAEGREERERRERRKEAGNPKGAQKEPEATVIKFTKLLLRAHEMVDSRLPMTEMRVSVAKRSL